MLNGPNLSGGIITIGPAGTFAGAGNIGNPTVVNGSIEPTVNTTGLNFAGNGNLTMNGGSTFVLQAHGGTVGVVQQVATFSYDANTDSVNLAAIPQDNTTLNGANTFTFLTYNSGPAAGVQSNWNMVSAQRHHLGRHRRRGQLE